MAEAYTVTAQRETSQLSAGGRFIKVMEIHFVTGSGVEASVTVPESQYSPEVVRALIESKVAALDAVQGL